MKTIILIISIVLATVIVSLIGGFIGYKFCLFDIEKILFDNQKINDHLPSYKSYNDYLKTKEKYK